MAATFPSRNEDDVALARIDILILEDEEFIDSILLERRNLNYYANWADEASIEDDILLATNLLSEGKMSNEHRIEGN